MNKILSEFQTEMDLLKHYIDFQNTSYKNQSKIEKNNPDSIFKSLTISKIKQFDFNSHIISIYGAFEHFIEQIGTKYLEGICLRNKLTDLLHQKQEVETNNTVQIQSKENK
jgi:hypothetical protein